MSVEPGMWRLTGQVPRVELEEWITARVDWECSGPGVVFCPGDETTMREFVAELYEWLRTAP